VVGTGLARLAAAEEEDHRNDQRERKFAHVIHLYT
jgi:hypothetical protein